MTDTPETPRRRNNDVEAADIYPKVEAMADGIEELRTLAVEAKTEAASAHQIAARLAAAGLVTADHNHESIERNVAQIIDVLEGPEKPRPFGQPSVREDGLVDAVATIQATQVTQGKDISAIKETLGNGGIKIKIPPGAWVAIIVAIITGLFNIAAVFAGR